MADDDWYTPHRSVARQPKPGVLLFEFRRGSDWFRCELRDHGEASGIEAQFYQNQEFVVGRRFDLSMSRTQTPRELAMQWAEQERIALESAF